MSGGAETPPPVTRKGGLHPLVLRMHAMAGDAHAPASLCRLGAYLAQILRVRVRACGGSARKMVGYDGRRGWGLCVGGRAVQVQQLQQRLQAAQLTEERAAQVALPPLARDTRGRARRVGAEGAPVRRPRARQ